MACPINSPGLRRVEHYCLALPESYLAFKSRLLAFNHTHRRLFFMKNSRLGDMV